MAFLRLGVSCAVIDDAGRLLLSQRGDLGAWNMPGGRLDAGESLAAAARREVYEETGLEVEILRPLGLYYYAGWQRLNCLFLARPVGGTLSNRSPETRANAFFTTDKLPADLLDAWPVVDALSQRAALHRIETPAVELLRLRWRFALRWLQNLLAGRPEPRHVRFHSDAVALIMDPVGRNVQVDALTGELPRIFCDGLLAPHEALGQLMPRIAAEAWRWAGLWQGPDRRFDFVFSAAPGTQTDRGAQWLPLQDLPSARERAYVLQIIDTPKHIWTLDAEQYGSA